MTEKQRKRAANLFRGFAKMIEAGDCPNEDDIMEQLSEMMNDNYTRTDAAKYLGISERQFDRLRNDGKIPDGKKKSGGLRLWHRRQLDGLKQ